MKRKRWRDLAAVQKKMAELRIRLRDVEDEVERLAYLDPREQFFVLLAREKIQIELWNLEQAEAKFLDWSWQTVEDRPWTSVSKA